VEPWAVIPVREIVRVAVVTGVVRVCDFSAEDRVAYDVENLKIDPLIIHLVNTHGASCGSVAHLVSTHGASWWSVAAPEENSPAHNRARAALAQVRLAVFMCLP
jgi:hypothetical protein